jgi:hypothetical protein
VSQSLNSLPKAERTVLHIVKIDSTVPADAATAVEALTAAGISYIPLPTPSAAI